MPILSRPPLPVGLSGRAFSVALQPPICLAPIASSLPAAIPMVTGNERFAECEAPLLLARAHFNLVGARLGCARHGHFTKLYFAGFPAACNVVAFLFCLLDSPVWLNVAVTIFLSVITVVPVTFLHSFRGRRLRAVNVAATIVWLFSAVFLVVFAPAMPTFPAALWWAP